MDVVVRDRAGWPVTSFEGRRWTRLQNLYAIIRQEESVWYFPPFLQPRQKITLPTGVLWPGFAINTLFYAAILWLIFAAPFAWRRWRRIKRGLCARCAYPVGMSDVCTECGAAVKVRAGAPSS